MIASEQTTNQNASTRQDERERKKGRQRTAIELLGGSKDNAHNEHQKKERFTELIVSHVWMR